MTKTMRKAWYAVWPVLAVLGVFEAAVIRWPRFMAAALLVSLLLAVLGAIGASGWHDYKQGVIQSRR